MNSMMDSPLTLDVLAHRAERHFATVEVVSRRPDRSVSRSTLGALMGRARRLARALVAAGLQRGDRVATLQWNHAEHLECYFGIPLAGAVVHTLNLRLGPEDLAYIATHARDRILFVDDVLLPLLARFRERAPFERVIVVPTTGAKVPEGMESYEDFLATGADESRGLPALKESDGLGLCYTSGTTGQPKGVLYSHRSTVLHCLGASLRDSLDLCRRDTILPVVPMFHVNAWGIPYAATMVGARLVMPGPHLDPASVLELMEQESVTMAAGVPTIWMGMLEQLVKNPGKWKLVKGLRTVVGGSAAPEALLRAFDAQGIRIVHAWGMTETSPLGSVAQLPPEAEGWTEDARYAWRATQGIPPPLVQVRARDEQGREVPWDGKTLGELEVRGPWVAGSYFDTEEGKDRWSGDGWFRTGDVVAIDAMGSLRIADRTKDLVKSGGEWISSVDLENALMGHPAVREAAVVAAPHPKWGERPVAFVVLREGQSATPDELRAHLAPHFAKFQLPEEVRFIDAIPRTSTGKFLKRALREQVQTLFTGG